MKKVTLFLAITFVILCSSHVFAQSTSNWQIIRTTNIVTGQIRIFLNNHVNGYLPIGNTILVIGSEDGAFIFMSEGKHTQIWYQKPNSTEASFLGISSLNLSRESNDGVQMILKEAKQMKIIANNYFRPYYEPKAMLAKN